MTETRTRWAHLAAEDRAAVSGEPSDGGRLVRSSAAVGLGTLLSRVTGLLRTILMAYALGKAVLSSSYNLANTTPNIVYDLILGGILSATLVPVFVDRLDRDDEDGVNAVVTVVASALVAITVAAMLAAPLIFHAYTWASGKNGDALQHVGVPLLVFFLPQIFFYGLTALGTALLNARRRFAVPAFAPVLNNVIVCGVLLWFAHEVSDPNNYDLVSHTSMLWLLGLGTTLGVVAMTVVLWPSLRASGWRTHWRFQPRHPAVKEVARLSGWTIGYVIANQVALLIVLALLAKESDSAVPAYLYAFQFFQLPYGLFAVSVMTTFTPELATAASRDDLEAYRDRFSLGIRAIAVVVLPASVGYILLSRPLTVTLLNHGGYRGNAALTGDALAAFAVGLIGFSIYLFTMRGFYAFRDTRTPFFLNVVENGINVVLALVLVGALHTQGIALSYSIAYLVAAVLGLGALRRKVGRLGGRQLVDASARMVVATAVMAAAVWLVTRVVGSNEGSGAVVRLAVGVVVGVGVYAAAAYALRIEEAQTVARRVLRNRH